MRNSAAPASDYDGRLVKAVSSVKVVSSVKTRHNHWAGDMSLVGAGVGLNPTRNQIFLITFDLALHLGESDLSSIHLKLKFYMLKNDMKMTINKTY